MSTLAEKYKKVKTMVGGNREKVKYEETFGMPMEEFLKITVPNKYIKRIMAQVEFAIRLSKQLENKYDDIVEAALSFLQDKITSDGVLTKAVCLEAEKILLPMKAAAKEYKLIYAAHAHIDMNWMWGWSETVSAVVATFQTMLKLLKEYPQFHFSQSQGSVYEIVDKYAPELKADIIKYIKEGRWEVTASAWVETDKNMPSEESLIQHIYQTKKYLKENWGIEPSSLNIDFSPDTFGHSTNIPEINALGGVDYLYHQRGLDGENALYRWSAPSGKEMLAYREQFWYNTGVTPLAGIALIDISNRSGGLKTGLAVYGVGDHGGGPTRRDIENIIDMMDWPIFPQVRFGKIGEFFKEAESVREKLPIVSDELNFVFTGCYTTQSRLKMANKKAETALYEAQVWDAFAKVNKASQSKEEQFASPWRKVLFNHFHDILTGSCVQDSREHAMGNYAEATAAAETRCALAVQGIASLIDTSDIKIDMNSQNLSEGAGVGFGADKFLGIPSPERGYGFTRIYHLYNSAPIERLEPVEITVWDWTGDISQVEIKDANGKTLEHQVLDDGLQTYWDHKYFRVLVYVKIPAFGYTTIVLSEKEIEDYKIFLFPDNQNRRERPYENIVLENEHIKAKFCFMSGELLSLIYKESGKEQIAKGKTGGLRVVQTERESSDAWHIGRYQTESTLPTVKIKKIEGSLLSGFEVVQKYNDSEVTSTITLKKNAKVFNVEIKADWHEITKETVPVLIYQLPIECAESFLYDVAGGAKQRKAMHMDLPALRYCAAINENKALALISDTKYGYRGTDDRLSCTLINSTNFPDLYPERGLHTINLSVGVIESNPKQLDNEAFCAVHKVIYQSGKVQKGTLKKEHSFLDTDLGTASILGMNLQDENIVIHLCENCGQDTKVTLSSSFVPISTIEICDIMGNLIQHEVKKEKDLISFTVKANSVMALKIRVN